MINLGTDVISDWSFTDGDLNIVAGTGNLGQAIENRLNTYIDDLSAFYASYGSQLFDYLGEMNKSNIHEYIKVEVEHAVIQDKRIMAVECIVRRLSGGRVECTLNVTLVDGTDIDLNMIITNENMVNIIGVE